MQKALIIWLLFHIFFQQFEYSRGAKTFKLFHATIVQTYSYEEANRICEIGYFGRLAVALNAPEVRRFKSFLSSFQGESLTMVHVLLKVV